MAAKVKPTASRDASTESHISGLQILEFAAKNFNSTYYTELHPDDSLYIPCWNYDLPIFKDIWTKGKSAINTHVEIHT